MALEAKKYFVYRPTTSHFINQNRQIFIPSLFLDLIKKKNILDRKKFRRKKNVGKTK